MQSQTSRVRDARYHVRVPRFGGTADSRHNTGVLYSSCDILEFLSTQFGRKEYVMASITTAFDTQFGLSYTPASHLLRWGTRQITVCRDFRTRFGQVHSVIDCRPGVEPGHLEILLFHKWLVILSRAR